jgi:hypothetical protein
MSSRNLRNAGLVEQYLEENNLSVNPTKRATFSSRQKNGLKILIKNREI